MATELKRMQQRRDTAADWAADNPVLLSGELGLDTDAELFKVGDGVTAWEDLEFKGDFAAAEALILAGIADTGSPIGAALSASYDAMSNIVQSKAVADGTTNNTTLLQAEMDAIETAGGGLLQLPAGVVVGAVLVATDCGVIGAGLGATVLKAPASLTGGVIQSTDYATLTGTASASPETRGSHRMVIADLTIDGNKANATNSVGIEIYGAGWRMSDVRVQNCGVDGIRTEFGIDVTFASLITLEGNADNILCCLNDGHGWRFRGPHDSNINNYVAHSNTGWGFRNESSATFYNGTLGHCSKFNMFLNANGWYVGAGVASYAGGQVAGAGGTGIEFQAGIGSVVMLGMLVAGWTTGAIIRGTSHTVDLLSQRNTTGVNLDGVGYCDLRLSGEVATADTVGILVTSETSPNTVAGMWSVAAAKAMVSGTFGVSSLVLLTQAGGAGNASLYVLPDMFTFPSGTELRTARALATTGSAVYAGRNGAKQTYIGTNIGWNGDAGLILANDCNLYRDGALRFAIPPDHTFRLGRNVTGSRPAAGTVGSGAMFYDTTLSKPIWSDGTVWRDAAGTAV